MPDAGASLGPMPAALTELDPEIAEILRGILAAPGPPAHKRSIAEARAAHERETHELSGPGEDVAEVRDLVVPGPAGGVPVRTYRPSTEPGLPVVAYFHGGGWAVGSLGSFDTLCRALANAAGAVVASVDYRLAPE